MATGQEPSVPPVRSGERISYSSAPVSSAASQASFFTYPRRKKYTTSRREIGQPVDDEQSDAGEYEVLKHRIRKGNHLKIRQHGIHTQGLASGVFQHGRRAAHGPQADEQRPENEPPPGRSKTGMEQLLQFFSMILSPHYVCMRESFRVGKSV